MGGDREIFPLSLAEAFMKSNNESAKLWPSITELEFTRLLIATARRIGEKKIFDELDVHHV